MNREELERELAAAERMCRMLNIPITRRKLPEAEQAPEVPKLRLIRGGKT